jgi:chromosome partitioning protein
MATARDDIRLSPKRVAQLLSISVSELERHPALKKTFGEKRETYSPADLVVARGTLGRWPKRLPQRRQLFLNFKGGTGKTSLSTAYAYRLWELGYRVLVVDLDSQGHATKCLGLEGSGFPHTLYDVLIRRLPLKDAIVESGLPGLALVPANLAMSTIELSLMPLAGREFKLRAALKDLSQSAEHAYDVVVLDAPPSFGLLNLNALMAANDLIVPVLADFLSFHGLKLLFETVQSLEDDLQHVLDHIFIVINSFNLSFKLAKEARAALETHYHDFLIRQVVRQCTKFAQASSEGRPIFAFDPASKGALDIAALVDELLARTQRPLVAAKPGVQAAVGH